VGLSDCVSNPPQIEPERTKSWRAT
jgi:hypothetical protein